MKKNLMLLALTGIFALAACSPPAIPAAQVQQLTDDRQGR
ncbi:YgdI/YgdR family lipoprotein [Deinococcus psychrotolerans]|nr:YgdI/YgdR family lipoprotein [Deinococcus psychrotolerans]